MRPAKTRWLALAVLSLAPATIGADSKLSVSDLQFFESKIRPLFVENCYKCHSQGSEKIKGGLLLDSREGVLKGGNTGPAVVPGNLEKSLLIQAVHYQDKDLQMPPNDRKLSDAQIADLEAWVKMGAPDPRLAADAQHVYKMDFDRAKKHWAFQPISKPAIPQANDPQHWAKTPIDSFILSTLLAKGMAPSPAADKVTLIRRATFDLTGLPPTTKEVDEFVADNSADAYEKEVDRLLKSPRYGERWGRYWLDLAHFADTKGPVGQNRDPRYIYAHTYRDWVIRSLNDDLPYDQFLMQQIAADQMALGENKKPLAALGFLTLGNRFNNQNNDIIDDRIDVLGKGTMALTVTCARCHDHKFDPIPTKDYYSLHGVFASSAEPKEGPLLETPKETPLYKDFLREMAAREADVAAFHDEMGKKFWQERVSKIGEYLIGLHEFKQSTNGLPRNAFFQRKGLAPQVAGAWDSSLQKWSRKHHPIFAPWFAFAGLNEKEFAAKAKDLAAKFYANQETGKPINPLVARLFVTPPTSLHQVAARYTSLLMDIDKRWQSALASYESRKKVASTPPPEPTALPEAPAEELRQILYAKNAPTFLDEKGVANLINRDNKIRNNFNALERAVNDVKFSHPGSPARAHVLEDADKPKDSFVMLRGNPGSKGPVVPRQFLEVLSGEKRQPFKQGSGRLELAQAIASRDNPLTARVIVNRIWLHHFGEGLVKTPDDFGTRSEPPTHPELLDYMASWFIEQGWSMKKLHRLMMLSSVYQQASEENPRFAQIDPNNHYLWQMNRRRLDFEALRDTILFIGGKLDVTMGGPAVKLNSEPYSTRRTIYGYVDRNALPNMFLAFDFANPDLTTGKRDSTIVPQQALFMMNSPLVVEQARDLVRRDDFKASARDEDRLNLLYKLTYQRKPTELEGKLASNFLHSESASANTVGDSVWEYGYGEFDGVAKRTKTFARMTAFVGKSWQLSATRTRENAKPGSARLSADGGLSSDGFSAIRRWTAPRDGFISIDGSFGCQPKPGASAVGRIVSSRTGLLGTYTASKQKPATTLPRVLVKRGDTIDFMVECHASKAGEAFAWAPIVRLLDAKDAKEWSAAKEFNEGTSNERLGGWEKFAQVLLETNEMTFIN